MRTVSEIQTGKSRSQRGDSDVLRRAMEILPLIFHPGACPGLQAAVQFDISGAGASLYTLKIAEPECEVQVGGCTEPTLSVQAPFDTWMAILRGQVSAADALTQGLISAQGDTRVLQQWSQLFQRSAVQAKKLQAPAGQRPAGPIPWSGSTWMTAALVPWFIFWITFGSFGVPGWASVGIPLLLLAILVGYRLRYNHPGLLELAGLAFSAVGGGLSLARVPAFATWGTIWSNLFLGIVWLASILAGQEPLSMQYAKWQFDRRIWGSGLFIYTNRTVSLVWGIQSILAGLIGCIGVFFPGINAPVSVVRYLTILPGIYLTDRLIKSIRQKPPRDFTRPSGGRLPWACSPVLQRLHFSIGTLAAYSRRLAAL
ncbi:MAG TPA: SCP2 sterol-binding domain-containing protein [Anaerolineaceae bacterium]|nr:SCP2 sterol-binding domain-containing protein [Anaerolineaceae bacterium]